MAEVIVDDAALTLTVLDETTTFDFDVAVALKSKSRSFTSNKESSLEESKRAHSNSLGFNVGSSESRSFFVRLRSGNSARLRFVNGSLLCCCCEEDEAEEGCFGSVFMSIGDVGTVVEVGWCCCDGGGSSSGGCWPANSGFCCCFCCWLRLYCIWMRSNSAIESIGLEKKPTADCCCCCDGFDGGADGPPPCGDWLWLEREEGIALNCCWACTAPADISGCLKCCCCCIWMCSWGRWICCEATTALGCCCIACRTLTVCCVGCCCCCCTEGPKNLVATDCCWSGNLSLFTCEGTVNDGLIIVVDAATFGPTLFTRWCWLLLWQFTTGFAVACTEFWWSWLIITCCCGCMIRCCCCWWCCCAGICDLFTFMHLLLFIFTNWSATDVVELLFDVIALLLPSFCNRFTNNGLDMAMLLPPLLATCCSWDVGILLLG